MVCLSSAKCQRSRESPERTYWSCVRLLAIQLTKFIGREVNEETYVATIYSKLETFVSFLDGQTLPVNRRQKAFNNGTLIIEQLQRTEDAGTYTCMAQNKQMLTARRNVEIQVLSMDEKRKWFQHIEGMKTVTPISSTAQNYANTINDEYVERGHASSDIVSNSGR